MKLVKINYSKPPSSYHCRATIDPVPGGLPYCGKCYIGFYSWRLHRTMPCSDVNPNPNENWLLSINLMGESSNGLLDERAIAIYYDGSDFLATPSVAKWCDGLFCLCDRIWLESQLKNIINDKD